MQLNPFLTFIALLFLSSPSFAGYLPLPAEGCPAKGKFNLDHFHSLSPLNSCEDSSLNELSQHLARGGSPFLSGVSCLAQSSFTTVIDLRSLTEIGQEQALVQGQGMTYFSFPMSASNSFSDVAANESSALGAINQIEATLKSNPDAMIYIHCARGEDRTGLVIALYRLLKSKCATKDVRTEMLEFWYTPYKSLDAVWNKYAH